MFDLDQLTDQTQELTIPYQGQVVHLKFTDSLTSKEMRELGFTPAEGEPDYGYNVRFVVRVVREWDVSRQGKKVPLTLEAVDELPQKLIAEIAKGVLGAIFPNPPSPEPTGSFS